MNDTLNAIREFMGPVKLSNRLQLKIIDENLNAIVHLNGMHWSCALEFRCFTYS